jgi:SAM-dependent methyltransferase
MRSAVIGLTRAILPRSTYAWIKDVRNAARVRHNLARQLLEKQILPAYAAVDGTLGGRVLWVGCRRYTQKYGRLFRQRGGEFWTTDIEPSHARWGEKHRHVTADLMEIGRQIPAGSFDCVLCNGVFGFGIDDRLAQQKALEAMAAILKPGGRLLLGWNTDRVEDPLTLECAARCFEPDDLTGLGARIVVDEAGYVYDCLRKRLR